MLSHLKTQKKIKHNNVPSNGKGETGRRVETVGSLIESEGGSGGRKGGREGGKNKVNLIPYRDLKRVQALQNT